MGYNPVGASKKRKNETQMPDLTIDLSHAVDYHYGAFPPQSLDLSRFLAYGTKKELF